ncbi:MAG: hypothetical protein ACTSRG_12980 [Candidatus Helarchaeota archaeon]
MNLGKLITFLEKQNPNFPVFIKIGKQDVKIPNFFHSYRGYYHQLALSKMDIEIGNNSINVYDFLNKCNECLEKTFIGYKGGEYIMFCHTPIWISDYGLSENWLVDRCENINNEIIIFAIEEDDE